MRTAAEAQPHADARALLEEGVRRFEEGDALGAHALFAQAHRRAHGDPRVMSWYGLTLVLVERNSNLGVTLGDQAARLAGLEPELVLNQARAHLALGQRERVLRTLQRGLEAAPGHPALQAALQALGRRRRPVIPFLPRGSALNVWLGRLRHRIVGAASSGPVTPMALGRLPGGEGRSHG